MNELTVTIQGWVATSPKLHISKTGTDIVSFRLASTARYFDRTTNAWKDSDTEWFTVRAFRANALLIHDSIEKGQPVVVVGRFRSHEWDSQTGPRTDLVIDAQTVGHDLTRGVAKFRRATVDGLREVKDVTPPPAVDDAEGQEQPPVDVSRLVEVTDEDLEAGVEEIADAALVEAPF